MCIRDRVHTDDFNLIADDDFEDVLQAYRELNEEGRLPIRVNEQIRFRRTDQLQRFLDPVSYTHLDVYKRQKEYTSSKTEVIPAAGHTLTAVEVVPATRCV